MTSKIASVFMYLSAALWPPSAYASSARRTCSALRSSSEYTATVAMPISRQVRMTRTAISPRLAIRTFFNTQTSVGTCNFLPLALETLEFPYEFNRLAYRALRRDRLHEHLAGRSGSRGRSGRPGGGRGLSERRARTIGSPMGVASRGVVTVLDSAASRRRAGPAPTRGRLRRTRRARGPRATERRAPGAQVAERPDRRGREDRRAPRRNRGRRRAVGRRRRDRRESHARRTRERRVDQRAG